MAVSPASTRHDTHSTTARGGSWSTRRIAVTALFSAAALVSSFIEIRVFPPAPWLAYDPSGIFALIAGFAYGPATGAIVAVLSWIGHMLFSFNPYGVLMAIVATVSLVVPAAAIYRRTLTMGGAAAGMAVGGIVSLACMIGANLVITPLYTPVSPADVMAMIVPILLPFNLIKIAITCVVTSLVYKPVSRLLED